jgi:hypothetical protein
MTGSGSDLVFIIIVPAICLAVWLIIVYHASSHPEWRPDRTQDRSVAREVGQDATPASVTGSAGPEPQPAVAGSVSGADG